MGCFGYCFGHISTSDTKKPSLIDVSRCLCALRINVTVFTIEFVLLSRFSFVSLLAVPPVLSIQKLLLIYGFLGGRGSVLLLLPSQGGQKPDGSTACERVCFKRPGGDGLV